MDEFYSVETDTLKHLYQAELRQLEDALIEGASWDELILLRQMVTRLSRALTQRFEAPPPATRCVQLQAA